MYYLSNKEIGDSLWSAHQSIKETRELLNSGVKTAGIVTFVAVLSFGFWSLLDAHRIAGPMHRLHRLLNEIADGKLTHEVQFRRRDEFSELAAATDRLVDNYAARLGTVRQQVISIEQALNGKTLSADQIQDLHHQAAELTVQLAFFNLPKDDSHLGIDATPLS